MLTHHDVIRVLDLQPHPEGGFYRETFRAEDLVFPVPSPLSGRGPRAASTAIYYLLESGSFSRFHRVRSDEVWHHYLGAPLELHLLEPAGRTTHRLGPHLERGERPQVVVKSGVLQAARPADDTGSLGTHDFSLVGCTVAPGFDFDDFEMPSRSDLVAMFPGERALIEAFTRA